MFALTAYVDGLTRKVTVRNSFRLIKSLRCKAVCYEKTFDLQLFAVRQVDVHFICVEKCLHKVKFLNKYGVRRFHDFPLTSVARRIPIPE